MLRAAVDDGVIFADGEEGGHGSARHGKMVATGEKAEGGTSEAIESFGGPCRGRTYGPLIKSQQAVIPLVSVRPPPFFPAKLMTYKLVSFRHIPWIPIEYAVSCLHSVYTGPHAETYQTPRRRHAVSAVRPNLCAG
jgi:hypothetical protein